MDEFERVRGRLFGIAYRMTGAASEAEEVLQDAWVRWAEVDRGAVRDPGAYLARVVTNLSIKRLTSARARREVYVGEWLPEPVLTGRVEFDALGPLEIVAERESVSFALLVLLERLTPAERAAYVLREAFEYGHREVAELIGTSEANARQLVSRARKRLTAEHLEGVAGQSSEQAGQAVVRGLGEGRRPAERAGGAGRRVVDRVRWRKLVEGFLAAARLGEVERLEELLAADVVSRADGGGKVIAARNPVFGRERVARYLIGVLERFGAGIEPYFAEANGEPVLVAAGADGVVAICFISIEDEQITGLRLAMNPDKLTFAAAQLSQIGGLPDLSS
ncbi:RNA polymerase sigma-70 factor [Kribbella hippodromi]|uniref:RNA polymerase sigma-70 factor n=1 Tax=Kribbella hippodromi TaxID=434347 RepID=A0ABN2DGB0_9ACTN